MRFFLVLLFSSTIFAHNINNNPYLFNKVFSRIEMADQTGLVLGEKKVAIRNVNYPYNASILEYKEGYLLAFRYDVPCRPKGKGIDLPYTSHIGIAELDGNFEQTDNEYVPIDVGNDFVEDPRIFYLDGELYVIYNAGIPDFPPRKNRTMFLAKINQDDFSVEHVTCFDLHIKPIEKNWAPFVDDSGDVEKLKLSYTILPHRIYSVEDPSLSNMSIVPFPEPVKKGSSKIWRWGDVRGGTPAKKMGDHYLGFFHSYFVGRETNVRHWYVMGAYTFSAAEPHDVISISNVPILYSTLYSTKPSGPTVDASKRVAYPNGFVEGKYEGKEVFFVSIGENDCTVKIIIIDQEKLYESLKML